GARVSVVAAERGPGDADPGLAGLVAVADVRVGAWRVVHHRRVLTAERRAARVRCARVHVVTVERRPAGADPGLACLHAVADRAVRTRRAIEHGSVQASGDGIAAIGGAGVAVVAIRRCPRSADAALAGLGAVADSAVRTGGAVHDGGM